MPKARTSKKPAPAPVRHAPSETYAARAARGRGLVSLSLSDESKTHITALAATWKVTKSAAVARAVAEALGRALVGGEEKEATGA